jgi:enoyl-CoA hydratase/carnithine racemase
MSAHSPSVEPSAEPLLRREDKDGVARLTLNRPRQFNALSQELLTALQRAFDAIAADGAVRVVVLAGAGKAFCTGHDLKEMRARREKAFVKALFEQCSRMMTTIPKMPQPVVARVHGVATAAGCQLVAACDLAVAAEEATFAVSGINVGVFCSTPAVALSRNVGRKAALEMLLTGEFIDAPTARERGLVNRVVPAADLDAETDRLAATLVGKSALAMSIGKRLFYEQIEAGLEAAYAQASETIACNFMADDAAEGVDAFIEKRLPHWRGR